MAFNLDDYEPVEARITAFWQKYPEGRIHTEIVLINEQQIVVKASVWTDREDQRPVTIDFAQETIGATAITKNSWLEVCATSAIGRALADLDFAKKGKRPSREEMRKAVTPANVIPIRDWLTEADVLAAEKNLEGLRTLYGEAVKGKAAPDTLDQIKQFAEKAKQD
jgi:hypothetical protein